mmetsp:Transcript_20705/g.50846  ORF Transcript_20705/g.50846 Transcript_20705/m.50846 type:complete len:99 (-) Transcript_20705:464-760(-)
MAGLVVKSLMKLHCEHGIGINDTLLLRGLCLVDQTFINHGLGNDRTKMNESQPALLNANIHFSLVDITSSAKRNYSRDRAALFLKAQSEAPLLIGHPE